jgi:hypothetical protein
MKAYVIMIAAYEGPRLREGEGVYINRVDADARCQEMNREQVDPTVYYVEELELHEPESKLGCVDGPNVTISTYWDKA